MVKRLIAMAAAAALVASPTVALAASAPAGSSGVAPASESVGGQQLQGLLLSPFLFVVIADIAIIVAALADKHHEPQLPPPVSP